MTSFGLLVAADNKYARLVDQTKAKIKGIKFRDVVGVPLSSNWKARFYLSLQVYNPTDLKFPITLDNVDLVLGNNTVTGSLQGSKEFIIDPEFNIFDKIPVEIPINVDTYQAIQSLKDPRVKIKARIYQLPIQFTYDIKA